MKEFLDVFIFKPKRTERTILFILKISFAFCYAIWIYKTLGYSNIVEKITDVDKLKYFLFDGHFILFVFLFLLLYFTFYKLSTVLFSFIGVFSMWLLHSAFVALVNLLVIIVSLLFWIKLKRFIYRPFWKIVPENEGIKEVGDWIKWFYLKAGILKSKEQRIRSSKGASKLLKEIREEIIENSDKIYNKIHTRFTLCVLLYCFYFYYLHSEYERVPYLDSFIFYFCAITVLVQLIVYWVYNHFRIIYYFFLVGHREIHRGDLVASIDKLLDELESSGPGSLLLPRIDEDKIPPNE